MPSLEPNLEMYKVNDGRQGMAQLILDEECPDACQSGEEGTDLLKLKVFDHPGV